MKESHIPSGRPYTRTDEENDLAEDIAGHYRSIGSDHQGLFFVEGSLGRSYGTTRAEAMREYRNKLQMLFCQS